MTIDTGLKPAVREYLAASTRQVHDALHEDPVLSKLTSPDLTVKEYLAALAAFNAFYFAIEMERKRFDLFEQFSLHRECDALICDLNISRPSQTDIHFASELELLGALYVAHGATFGRNTFRANVLRAVKGKEHHFVSLRPAPDLWNELTNRLDCSCQSKDALAQMRAGAERSFSYMRAACIRSRQDRADK